MGRQGLNGVMSYTDGTTAYTYQFRAGMIGYGTDMVYAEDQARTQRAYYPHRSANQQFSVQVLLKDWDERADFMSWITNYAQFALDPNLVRTVFPFMQVTVPVRDFTQQGMPLTGYEWGAHAAMMAFSPVFVFEAAQSPGQSSSTVTASSVNATGAYASDPAIQYFYPFSTQLEASQVPVDYGTVSPAAGTSPSATGAPSLGTQATATSLTAPGGTPLVPGVSSASALGAAVAYPPPGFTGLESSDLNALASAIDAGGGSSTEPASLITPSVGN
jgi:hypothetical protein